MNHYLTSIEPDQNRYRFYRVMIEPGLFGNYYLTRHWGRMGTKGRKLTTTFHTMEDATKELNRLLGIRERHGYREHNERLYSYSSSFKDQLGESALLPKSPYTVSISETVSEASPL